MSAPRVDIARGTGSLLGGATPLRDVPYRIFAPGRTSAGAAPIEGAVEIAGLAEATVLAGVDDLVLQLEDGRRLAIALTTSTGHIVVRGVGPEPDGIRRFAERYTAAWCGQDPARVAAFFAPDGTLTVNDGQPAAGRAAISDVARGFMRAFPDLSVHMDEVVTSGDRFEYRWTLSGTHDGPGGTGRPVRISGVENWRLSAEGLIGESRGYFDAEEYQRQIDGRP